MQVNEYQKAAMATLNPALDKKDVLHQQRHGLVRGIRRSH